MADTPTISLSTPTGPVEIPQLGFGVWQVEDDAAPAAVRTALEAGYRSIDTARIYGNEEGVGRGLAEAGLPREEVFVTTKVWNDDQTRVAQALDASLERLGLDHVDLYLIHWPTPAKDTYVQAWQAMREARDAGRTRVIGVCNFDVEHVERLEAETGELPAINQVELHPYFAQRELRAAMRDKGIAVEAWSPLGQGGELLEDEVITGIADAHGVTPAQVVLRWHVQLGNVVIPKSVTPSRIRENLDVFGFELSEDEMARIDGLDKGEEGRMGPRPSEFND